MQRIERKSLMLTLDAAQEGSFTARIATFNVVDKDGDVTLAGAFPDGKRVLVSAYMHGSWSGALPVGDGVISSDTSGAYLTGKFWLNTDAGQQTYLAVKNAGELQEYSYGFKVLDSSTNPADLSPYPGAMQILSKLDVVEVSPVLVGAGVNTGTLAIKSARPILGGAAVLKARATIAKLKAGTLDSAMIAAIAAVDAMTDELDDAVDALMVQAGIPDPDEDGGDLPSEDDTSPDGGYDMMDPNNGSKGLSFADHSSHAQAGVTAFLSRAKSLADLRAKKQRKDGRVLSATNRTRLNALHDSLVASVAEISDLLTSTEPQSDAHAADDSAKAERIAADKLVADIWLDVQRRQAELAL